MTTHDMTVWTTPAMTVQEKQGDLRLLVNLPGVGLDDVELTAEQRVLTLQALRADRDNHGFRRELRLPEGHRTKDVTATLKDGVLVVLMPKGERKGSRRIEVKAA